ncbi:MAG: NAD(P)-dependent oxidoreductase, partial [Thaumarchaeota archaeon]
MSLITPNLAKLISLKGRRALVTGAASGIGEATAYRLAEAGAGLELVDIDMDGLRLVGDKISKTGVEVNLYKVDLSCKDEIDALWDSLRGR